MTSCTTTSSEPLNTASGGKRSGSTATTCSRSMGMRSVLWRFDQVFGLRRSCSEEWSVWGGCGVLDWTLGLPCSPLSRLISSRRRWFSAWAARRSAITSSSTLSSRLTSSRACSSTMLCRSRSSSIVPLAPVARGGVYGEPLCQIPSVVATRQGMGFQPPIFEMIPSESVRDLKAISEKEFTFSGCWRRVDQNVVLGQCRMALQSCFNCLHRRLTERDALVVHFAAQLDNRMKPLPGHLFGPLQHRLRIDQLRPIPLQL